MNENHKEGPITFSYGGQAVIEGVMMRGTRIAAIAVRDIGGKVVLHEQALNATLYRGRISKIPFVRGVIGLWDALGLGTRALMWSADIALGEEEVNFNGSLAWGTVFISLLLGIGIFFVLPTAVASGVANLAGLDNQFLTNLIESFIRLILLISYIWLIARLPDVKRLFGYHGAEHKTINAYESGAELTPEIVATFPIEHPRCGTAFLLTVVFVSLIVFSVFGRPPLFILFISRILLIPIIAGISYEILRFTASHMDNPLIHLIVIPNLALQHLTTREPDLSMIEVAIAAFNSVMEAESEERRAIFDNKPLVR